MEGTLQLVIPENPSHDHPRTVLFLGTGDDLSTVLLHWPVLLSDKMLDGAGLLLVATVPVSNQRL